ncbi:hypothetical protein [Drosophila suzukii associated hytrosavirus 1]|nr:hypothetical protein [Drosophila suzukii associated hytrosavirus 1]
MKQTFYVNVLFGKNKARIFEEISKVMVSCTNCHFQVHPFRMSPVNELGLMGSGMQQIRDNIKQHLEIMEDIRNSSLKNMNKPFQNTIFVNYTTRELEPAIKYDRIKYYICDFVNEQNIEILTLVSPIFINFLKKSNPIKSLNSVFMNYSVLTFYDTNVNSRIGNEVSLDLGEETKDDMTFLQTRLRMASLADEEEVHIRDGIDIILPYHPFRQSLFASIQNAKDNINAVQLSKRRQLIYYPFGQDDWLLIMRNIMYEHVILNYLITDTLYEREHVQVVKNTYRNNMSFDFRHFKRIQRKHKTHVLNELVFNYKDAFKNNTNIYINWYNRETKVDINHPALSLDILCTRSTQGIFI